MKSGIINIYKEAGYTSFDVCAKLRGILREKKIGHTGTLDPMAVGVLPVCIGKATKLVGLLTDKPKEYVAEFKLGETSDTQDNTGTVLKSTKMYNENNKLCFADSDGIKHELSKEDIVSVIKGFEGRITQLTPMYSARKVDGKKLYEYARAGIEVKRKTVTVNIYLISDIVVDTENASFSMRVLCEKGTYIRTLGNDIGEKLGCGALMTALTRTKVDVFDIEQSVKLSELEKLRDEGRLSEVIIGADRFFSDSKALKLEPELLKYVYNGNPLRIDNFDISFSDGERVRLYDDKGNFLALYKYDGGMLRTEAIFFEE